MWIVTDDATGAIVAGPAESEPTPAAGQTLRRVPIQTRWDAALRAFVDAPRWIRKFDFVLLWPVEANAAVHVTTDPAMARAWAMLLGWDGPINLDDPMVIAGVDRAVQIGILTTAQADRIKAGLPPL